MKTFEFSLVLCPRENTDAFIILDANICGIHSKRVNILYILLYMSHNVFVCVEVLRPSQPNRVMSSAVSLPNHMFTGQA